jgi:hypothetical protein
MAYKLAEEDKLCGVIYPTYEGFSPIPKVTCDMLESKCEQTIVVKCGESSEEDKKPESQSGSASASASESSSESESTSESNSTSESQASTSESSSESTSTGSTSTSESTSVSESTSESTYTTESTTTSESTSVSTSESASSSTENSNTPEEPKPTPEPQPEPVPTIDLLEVLPKVDDKFSKLIVKDGQVVEVPEVSEEEKRAFEDKIINELKAKLPEGTTVEAVLEGANYEKGSEVIAGKTNYTLKVRTTLNGKVSEHTYKVPHTEEAPKEEPAVPEAPEEVLNGVLNSKISFGAGNMDGNVLTILNYNGETLTESNIKQFAEEERKYYEDKLNEGRPDSSKYKVEFTITQRKHIGDSLSPIDLETSIFTSHIKITKPNGDVIEKDKPVNTFVIETL